MRSEAMRQHPYLIHTNLELGLMLRGQKPLARFTHEGERTPDCMLRYFRMFDRHVESGRFAKHESQAAEDDEFGCRLIMYSLPGEEWRFQRMIDLLAQPGPWTVEREREEGELLGYEDWMNDVWLAGKPLERLRATMPEIVILTGAGISAESGVPTFRDAGGLWEGHRFEDVATPEAFARDPETVQRFYDLRRAALPTMHPNAAHRALARLAAEWPGRLTLVTQNVDDLHDRAHVATPPADGFRLIHMHGQLRKARCTASGTVVDWPGDMAPHEPSRHHPAGRMRPHIVWFGEIPMEMETIEAALAACDLFVSIGTSGAVWPAAGFVRAARAGGARTLEINLDTSMGTHLFDEARYGPASVEVPRWVEEMLSPQPGVPA